MACLRRLKTDIRRCIDLHSKNPKPFRCPNRRPDLGLPPNPAQNSTLSMCELEIHVISLLASPPQLIWAIAPVV